MAKITYSFVLMIMVLALTSCASPSLSQKGSEFKAIAYKENPAFFSR